MAKPNDPFYGHTPYSTLILRMSALGDILLLLPAIIALKNAYRKTRLYWALDAPYQELLESVGEIDTLVPFDRPAVSRELRTLDGFWKAVGRIWDFAMRLRRLRFTHAFVFQPLLRAGLFACASGARVIVGPRRWAEGSYLFYHFRKRVDPTRHMVEQNLALLAGTRADLTPVKPSLPLTDAEREELGRLLAAHGLAEGAYAVITPGASHAGKQWTVAGYAALGDYLGSGAGLRPILVAGPDEREAALVESIAAAMQSPPLVLSGLGLRPLAALFSGARLVAGPDTGPMHLANLVGAPVLSLFGPTDPAIWRPYWQPCRVLRDATAVTFTRRALYDLEAPAPSMEALRAEQVIQACAEFLEQTAPSA